LLKRWIFVDKQDRTLAAGGVAFRFAEDLADLLDADRMAEKKMKWDLVSAAMTWARGGLAAAGRPQKIRDERLSVSIMRRRMRPSPSRWLLAGKLGYAAGAHALGKRCGG